jgi:F-type H+-transporting ATPase subunit b
MLIDWFTVGAQAVNFLILVWLLKRFLYRPVLAAIDAREKKIAAQLADAAQREARAQAERADLQHRSETLERARGSTP